MTTPIKAALLGASGYTGADLLRLGVRHPGIEFVYLTANTHAGKPMSSVFPHLGGVGLPDLITNEDVDFSKVDVVFCGLPHGTSQTLIAEIVGKNDHLRVIDMGADFRFRNPDHYQLAYGARHVAPELQAKAAYGLTEHNRDAIRDAKVIACPGCYPTATLLALLPLVRSGAMSTDDVIIDAKSGVSGAGRGLKQNTLMAEAGESVSPYAVGTHRHAPEIEQEISLVSGAPVAVNFTPHLIPMSRGELITAHVKLGNAQNADEVRAVLAQAYADEPFIRIADKGVIPSTAHVRGSNYCVLNVFEDRIPGRVIVIGVIDNLVKGSAGQAIQNFNLAFGFDEAAALEALPLFP
ncbi:N-acetyl-gamma-glutamyl-phosphate reductase [Pelagibacterium lentulum]|uniref:N-acetyl-gamma-glutamyl-phosphate reductase n=1 Tax=Pelagibacterium lentulum TaxID=2029865 RepID=A0A916VXN5_9HYPH|nr:N-acetyl-gamma-glutamyl-phosphate reductase [Pelagibacterium lentulum]GGA51314.1 N-acetyl-gamma-glutamyl-phosphate reductase [Pelagibacterium lentulum]